MSAPRSARRPYPTLKLAGIQAERSFLAALFAARKAAVVPSI
jgi:hypothetical protein